jgi:hypothetical protein
MTDTSPAMRAVHARLVANLEPAQRIGRVRELTLAANLMALAGLRRRYPRAPDEELFLRLASLRLGAEAIERAYGWHAPDDGP